MRRRTSDVPEMPPLDEPVRQGAVLPDLRSIDRTHSFYVDWLQARYTPWMIFSAGVSQQTPRTAPSQPSVLLARACLAGMSRNDPAAARVRQAMQSFAANFDIRATLPGGFSSSQHQCLSVGRRSEHGQPTSGAASGL